MLLDKELLPCTVMAEGFDVAGIIYPDGRKFQVNKPRYPRRLEVQFSKEMNCTMELQSVWDGATPDQHGGFTKGELLGAMDPTDSFYHLQRGALLGYAGTRWVPARNAGED